MSSDSTSAAADLADALDDFTDKAAGTGAERDVWLTVGAPHDNEQRTVQLPADVADWIAELLRAEQPDPARGAGSATHDQDDGERRDDGQRDAGQGDDGAGTTVWWG
ncbi:hypothetical protein [Kitasatospora sp. NPDC057223]|uniref:hypothetical protein n=1 Tax=Kitasatospora sp. NPDC057223 TaxID=3346055 RepID=UPI003642CF60